MSDGEILECDEPHKLLRKKDGHFTEMVKMTGNREADLRKAAEKVKISFKLSISLYWLAKKLAKPRIIINHKINFKIFVYFSLQFITKLPIDLYYPKVGSSFLILNFYKNIYLVIVI